MGRDRIALVTGGGSGIGEATCMRLARDGCAVAVLGRHQDNIAAVANRILASGGRAIAVRADVSRRPELHAAVDAVRVQLGPVTVLVNNAGIEDFTPFERIEEELWDQIMATNLKSVYQLSQYVVPDMIAAGWGRIINVTALGAHSGAANMVHYTASKGGVMAFGRSLAVELGSKGITVNNVSPGFVLTPMAQRAIDDNLLPVPYQQIVASYPVPRIGRPEEVAAAISFFAAEDAGYITAQTLGVNGGCFT
jgi:NAD(P)-dependent dehydrogenase (short-subunit alcohol dehydrogenase family)